MHILGSSASLGGAHFCFARKAEDGFGNAVKIVRRQPLRALTLRQDYPAETPIGSDPSARLRRRRPSSQDSETGE